MAALHRTRPQTQTLHRTRLPQHPRRRADPRVRPPDARRRSRPATSTTGAKRLVAEGKLSARSINRHLTQLHGIFARAQKAWGLAGNPVSAADRQPEHRSGDFQVLDPNDVTLLAAVAHNTQDAAIFIVAAFTGLRLGELLALRWCDVDFAKATVHVRWNHVQGETDQAEVAQGAFHAADRQRRAHARRTLPAAPLHRSHATWSSAATTGTTSTATKCASATRPR